MMDVLDRHPWVAGATTTYLAAALAAAPWLGWRRVVPYVVVVSAVATVVAWVDRRRPLPAGVLAAISALGFAHCAGGLLPAPGGVLYETWLVDGVVKYDQATHLVGTGIAAVAAWYAWPRGRIGLGRGAHAALLAIAIGVVNEMIEYGLAARATTYVGGLDNAAWDLAFNTAGAVTAALLLAARQGSDAIGHRPYAGPTWT